MEINLIRWLGLQSKEGWNQLPTDIIETWGHVEGGVTSEGRVERSQGRDRKAVV